MVIELCVVQFWSEIILVISNQTRAARSFDFEITRMSSDQIALWVYQNLLAMGLRARARVPSAHVELRYKRLCLFYVKTVTNQS